MAQLALGVVGGVLGSFVGMPQLGFVIGSAVGGLLFAPDTPTIKQEGPRLTDLTVQSPGYGNGIPFGIGTTRIVGDVIWCPGIVETIHKDVQHAGGKGGGGKGGQTTELTTYTYSVDVALQITKGVIAGITRVWADGKCIIDTTGASELTEVQGLSYRIYNGTEDQLPDPLIEADKGVGQVPAHRGMAYIVFEKFQLINFANHIPKFEFEVTMAGSVSYPVILSDVPETSVVTADESRGLLYAYVNPNLIVMDLFSMVEVQRKNIGSFTNPCIAGGDEGLVIYETDLNSPAKTSGYINKDTLEIKNFPLHLGPDILGLTAITPNSMAIITTAYSRTIVYRGWFGGMQAYSFARKDTPSSELNQYLKDTDHYDATVKGVPGTFFFTGGLFDTVLMYGNNRVHTLFEDPYHFRDFGAQSHSGSITIGRDYFEVSYEVSAGLGGDPDVFVKLNVIDSSSTTIGTANGINGTMFYDERDDSYVLDNQTNLFTGTVLAEKIDPKTLTVLSSYGSSRLYPTVNASDLSTQEVGSGHFWAPSVFRSDLLNQNLDTGETVSTHLGYSITSGGLYHRVKANGAGYGVANVNGVVAKIFLGRFNPNDGALIRDYIQQVAIQVGLDPLLDIDLSEIDQTAYGYFTATNTGAKSLVQPLAQLYAFDMAESDYVIKFVKRNQAPVATIKSDQIIMTSDNGDYLNETVKSETDLPAQVSLVYTNPDKDYNSTIAPAMRPSNPSATMWSQSNLQITAPISLKADQAKALTESLLYTMWNERRNYSYSVDSRFLYLDPTDVVTFQDAESGEQSQQRLTGINVGADLSMALNSTLFDARSYQPSGIEADPGEGWDNTISNIQPSQLILLDTPMLRDIDNIPLVYTLMCGYGRPGWRGGLAYMSSDNGTTYQYKFAQNSEATIGFMLDALPQTSRPFSTDNDTVARVKIQTQPEAMSSVTQFDMVSNFANAAAVRSGTEWEIIQFRDCVQIDSNTFQLSGLLRGRRGTDYCTDSHAVNDQFVLLQMADVSYTTFAPNSIGNTYQFRVASAGQSLETLPSQNLTFESNTLRPYAPVHVEWSLSGLDLVLTWQRRTRFNGELNSGVTGVDTSSVPLNETTETYQLKVMNGTTVLNTYTVTGARTWTYNSAMQTADGFGVGCFVVISQISELAGLGFPSRPAYYGTNVDAAELSVVISMVRQPPTADIGELSAIVVYNSPNYAAIAELQAVAPVGGYLADVAVDELQAITLLKPPKQEVDQKAMAVIGLISPLVDLEQTGMAIVIMTEGS